SIWNMKLFDVAPLQASLVSCQAILFSKVEQFLFSHAFTLHSGSPSGKSQAGLSGHKKIMILQTPIRFYPAIGGVENHVYYLSKELINNGYDIKIICANEPQSDRKNIDSVTVERLGYLFKITNTNISFSLPLRILQSHFDVIHTHMPTPWSADWSVLIAKVMKKSSVITIHNDMDKSSF